MVYSSDSLDDIVSQSVSLVDEELAGLPGRAGIEVEARAMQTSSPSRFAMAYLGRRNR